MNEKITLTLNQKLLEIQSELKVPKSQFNTFSKYKYRNCEDILEALKPLLKKHQANLIIWDEIQALEGRWYVKATVRLEDAGGEPDQIFSFGWAREEEVKKGMDGAQITGAASSYARKYALNGLFLIDDTADADSHDNTKTPAKVTITTKSVGIPTHLLEKKDSDPVTPQQKQQLVNMMKALEMDKDAMGLMIESVLNKPTVDTYGEFQEVLKAIEGN